MSFKIWKKKKANNLRIFVWFLRVMYKKHIFLVLLSHVWLFANPWAVDCQAPLSMVLSRQEYWSGLPCPPPGDLLKPGIESRSLALQGDSLPSKPPGKSKKTRWVAYPFSRGSSQPRNQTGVSCIVVDSLPAELPGKHIALIVSKCFLLWWGVNQGKSLEVKMLSAKVRMVWRWRRKSRSLNAFYQSKTHIEHYVE